MGWSRRCHFACFCRNYGRVRETIVCRRAEGLAGSHPVLCRAPLPNIEQGSRQRCQRCCRAMHIGDRSDIFYASWHQYPFYPGSGAATRTNRHQTIVNCPLHIGACETELLASWQTRVRPALEEFEPQVILISAGFDADTATH